jgi:hypothetical protein
MKNKQNECNPMCHPVYTMVTLLSDEDLVKAWQIIDRLKVNEIYDVDKIHIDRRDLFIKCIKQRIDTFDDCIFSNNYKKIKKLK